MNVIKKAFKNFAIKMEKREQEKLKIEEQKLKKEEEEKEKEKNRLLRLNKNELIVELILNSQEMLKKMKNK